MKIVAILIGLAIAFVIWRMRSVARGMRRRDEVILRVLDPLADKLHRKETPSASEIGAIAAAPQNRLLLHQLLSHHGATSLFPAERLDARAQGEAHLAYWLMHPNESGAAPEEMVLQEEVARSLGDREGRFFVFRYRMAKEHWSGGRWKLGVAGPFFAGDEPFAGPAGAFARGDDPEQTKPAELVDWFCRLVSRA